MWGGGGGGEGEEGGFWDEGVRVGEWGVGGSEGFGFENCFIVALCSNLCYCFFSMKPSTCLMKPSGFSSAK